MAGLAGLGTLVLLGFVCHRAVFLTHAERATGRVVQVLAKNDTCWRKHSYRPCTRYTARVRFDRRDGRSAELEAEAGRRRGYNQPLRLAWYEVNDVLPVVYDPELPSKAYVDDESGLWKVPFFLAVGVGIAWLMALFGGW